MDIKRLTHFIALAEDGRFALAAARVHLSQAAFSRSIQTLEGRVGLRLFDRGAKGARLTPVGEVLLRRAKELVFDSRCLERDIELVKRGDVGEISVGAAPIPAAVLVPEMLCQLRQQSPLLVTRVSMGNLPNLLAQLDSQSIDFCLGDPRLVAKSSRYEMISVGRQFGGLYCRKGHPLARKRLIGAEALQRYGVALISISPMLMKGLATGYGFEAASDFPLAVECDDIGILLHLVTHTDVLGLLPKAVAERCQKPLHLLEPANANRPYADVHAIWLKGRTLSPSAKRAIKITQDIGTALAGNK